MFTASRLTTLFLALAMAAGCGDEHGAKIQGATEQSASVGSIVSGLTVADCPAGSRIIEGTAGPDRLVGTSGVDCLLGWGGDDTLYGYGSNDFLVGGDGNDLIYGGGGSDAVYGGPDADVIHGGAGNDLLHGDEGDDVLDGDANADQVWGGAGDDVLYGDNGNDALYGDAGDDALIGGAGTNTSDGGAGIDACSGANCEKPALALSGCTEDSQCTSEQHCIVDVGLCLGCVSDQDGDSVCDSQDGCPNDLAKVALGVCGCGVSENDRDADGTPDCLDACPDDAAKTAAGVCGCGALDVDSDMDGTLDCQDACPTDATKLLPGACGCGAADIDSDGDGLLDCVDSCPESDNSIDENANGEPDGCETPVGCTWETVGRGVHRGDAFVSGEESIAQLAGITCITGALNVQGNFPNLAGLESLTAVAGALWIYGNYMLESLEGLDGLTSVGGLFVLGNDGFTSLSGLDALTSVEGTVSIQMNTSLESLAGLAGLRLIGGMLYITDNAQLRDITALYNLAGPAPLPYGWLTISNNASLPACQGWRLSEILGAPCSYSSVCENNTGTGSCGELPPDFACVYGASGPGVWQGDLWISPYHSQPLSGVTCVTGSVIITNTSLQDLSALGTLQQIGSNLDIRDNLALRSLNGLEKLTQVGGQLQIDNNPALADVAALAHLNRIGESLPPYFYMAPVSIKNNASLAQCDAWTIAGRTGRSCVQSGTQDANCSNNTGTASCPLLPADFECVAGAKGPGVHDGTLNVFSNPEVLSGLHCVTGSLYIDHQSNLSSLSSLQKVGGSLNLWESSAQNVDGLANLTEIGLGLWIQGNQGLESLAGLSQLRSLGARSSWINPLQISNNPSLPACWVWMIEGNTGARCRAGNYECLNGTTGSCGELPADFACIPGAQGPGVYDGSVFGSGYDAARYSGITCATGDVYVDSAQTSVLQSLQKVGGNLWVLPSDGADNLDDLARLTHVGGTLSIEYNDSIADLSGLSALRDTGLNIHHNAQLPGCWVWGLLQDTGNYIVGYAYANDGTMGCGTLPEDFACVPGAKGPGVYDGDVEEWNPSDLGGLTCVTGNLTIRWSGSTDLTRFADLQRVGGALRIEDNYYLTSLAGLEQLTEVGASLSISNNAALESLAGLAGLTTLGSTLDPAADALWIAGNAALPACWPAVIEQQTGATCGGQTACADNAGQGSCSP